VQAIDEINARSDILPTTQLKAHWTEKLTGDDAASFASSFIGQASGQYITDSGCDETMSMNVFMQHRSARTPKLVQSLDPLALVRPTLSLLRLQD
jgi:hypothetical protein